MKLIGANKPLYFEVDMRVLVIFLSILIFATVMQGQNTIFKGRVSDVNGAAVDKVKVTLTDAKNTDFKKRTYSARSNADGMYSLRVPAGSYIIEYSGVRGFLLTRVENFRLAYPQITLDIVLEIDMEDPLVVYSELVCDRNNNCEYVSRKGDGTSTPKEIIFMNIKPKKRD